jgi:hypothetical protein
MFAIVLKQTDGQTFSYSSDSPSLNLMKGTSEWEPYAFFTLIITLRNCGWYNMK